MCVYSWTYDQAKQNSRCNLILTSFQGDQHSEVQRGEKRKENEQEVSCQGDNYEIEAWCKILSIKDIILIYIMF